MRKTSTKSVSVSALLIVALGAGLGLVACDRENRALGEAPSGAVNRALQSIAATRCDRAMRCQQIGSAQGQKWSSLDACVTSVRQNEREDINLYACPGGIDQKELNECLAEIRSAECGSALDAIQQMAACRSSDLCLN
jgi:hypothetical protein